MKLGKRTMEFHRFVYRSGMITNSKVNQMQMYTVSYHLFSKVAIRSNQWTTSAFSETVNSICAFRFAGAASTDVS